MVLAKSTGLEESWFNHRALPTGVSKPGDRYKVNNYRPASILPVVAKVFEAIVLDQLFGYLEKSKILCEEQAGFGPNRSTQDVLLRATDDWKKALDLGQSVAFDSINYDLLLRKLYAYGIRDAEPAWFADYLSERKQRPRVLLNNVPSEWAKVTMYGCSTGVHPWILIICAICE